MRSEVLAVQVESAARAAGLRVVSSEAGDKYWAARTPATTTRAGGQQSSCSRWLGMRPRRTTRRRCWS